MRSTVKPIPIFASYLVRACGPGTALLLSHLLLILTVSVADAQEPPLDTIITIQGQQVRCRVLRMSNGMFIARIGKGVLSFPLSEVKAVYIEGKNPYGEVEVSSATSSVQMTLNNRPVDVVALSPLRILDVSSETIVRRPGGRTYERKEYIRGYLSHRFDQPLRELRVSFSFQNEKGFHLGDQDESYFVVSEGQILPFVLDLTQPFGQSQIARIVVSVISFQSRFQRQLNYQGR